MSAVDKRIWEQWDEGQRAYKFGVILILPSEPVFSQVNALRAQHDPLSQAICDAHISLTMPLPQEPSDENWAELGAVAAAVRRFTIKYGPPMTYPPHPGVVLKIEPQLELDRLRAHLESCRAFLGSPPRPYPFSAHMTIAEYISLERTASLMAELNHVAPSGAFVCEGVSHVVPDESFHFCERRKLPFRG